MSSDIKGGNNAGIDTCWFNPEGPPSNTGIQATYQIRALDELKNLL